MSLNTFVPRYRERSYWFCRTKYPSRFRELGQGRRFLRSYSDLPPKRWLFSPPFTRAGNYGLYGNFVADTNNRAVGFVAHFLRIDFDFCRTVKRVTVIRQRANCG